MDPNTFNSFLSQISPEPLRVIDDRIPLSSYVSIDISENQAQLHQFDVTSSKDWEVFINDYLKKHEAQVAYGGYLETRDIYKRSEHFNKSDKETERNIHLGMDLWAAEETAILAPLDGKIHSFRDNIQFGDYGPTIILEHHIQGIRFFTLYGHLTRESITNLEVGQSFSKGQIIAALGAPEVNGDYAPHLHFQIIRDMQGYYGDFPGVCSKKNLDKFKELCPDPNLLLKVFNGTPIF